MDKWIIRQGECTESGLAGLLTECQTGEKQAVAFFSDAMSSCHGDRLADLLRRPDKLLELRVFDRSEELWVHRTTLDAPFVWRVAGERSCDPNRDYILSRQALDIDETYDAYRHGETDALGSRKLRSTVKGCYTLPVGPKDVFACVISYVRYDGCGMAGIADYRLAGFEEREGE